MLGVDYSQHSLDLARHVEGAPGAHERRVPAREHPRLGPAGERRSTTCSATACCTTPAIPTAASRTLVADHQARGHARRRAVQPLRAADAARAPARRGAARRASIRRAKDRAIREAAGRARRRRGEAPHLVRRPVRAPARIDPHGRTRCCGWFRENGIDYVSSFPKIELFGSRLEADLPARARSPRWRSEPRSRTCWCSSAGSSPRTRAAATSCWSDGSVRERPRHLRLLPRRRGLPDPRRRGGGRRVRRSASRARSTTSDFPIHAIRYCLEEGRLLVDDLDCDRLLREALHQVQAASSSPTSPASRARCRAFLRAMPSWLHQKLVDSVADPRGAPVRRAGLHDRAPPLARGERVPGVALSEKRRC